MEISIIVPVYNSEKYLKESLDALLAQTYKAFEIILVNDGSTDGSRKICDEYVSVDDRIRVFHKNNGGVSSARNLGIREARGNFVTFVDADDKVLPSFLEDFNLSDNQADFFVQGYINWTGLDEFKKISIARENHFYSDLSDIFEELELKNFVLEAPWAKLFKRSIIVQHNHLFNESLSNAEDHLFVIGYLQFVKSIYVCKTSNYCYKKFDNTQSLSQKFVSHDKLYLYATLIYEARLNNIKKHNLSSRYQKFSVDVHNDLLHKSLVRLFSYKDSISSNEKSQNINKYLSEIDQHSKRNELKTVKTGVLIRKIWKSGLPLRLFFLEKIFGKK